MIEEAVRVFGSAEQLPQRDAVDAMDYTVSCLKVPACRRPVATITGVSPDAASPPAC